MDDPQTLCGFWRNQHSFFDDLVTMLITLSSYIFTLNTTILSNNPREFNQRSLQEWISYIRPLKDLDFPLTVEEASTKHLLIFYPAEIIHHIALNGWPDVIPFRFQLAKDDGSMVYSIKTSQNRSMLSRLVGASFINYYSSQEDKIKTKFGKSSESWPAVLNFARTVRNGFAHGGSFHILNPNECVNWRIWAIDHQRNGTPVLFEPSGLSTGDIVRLMEEIDTTLR